MLFICKKIKIMAIKKYEKLGDKLDRYRAHLIEGAELNDKQKAYFEKLNYTNSLLCQGFSDQQVANILVSGNKFAGLTGAYGVIRDAKEIWGNIKKSSKDGMRHVMYENFMRLAKKAENEGKIETASDNYEKASKLYALFQADELAIDINKFMSPVSVFFSSNPKFLMNEDSSVEDME